MSSWLDLVVKATSQSEAPERYFWWSALATISAVVRKNVYLDRFYYKLYPNVYVVLVSSRSGLRKGLPISMANSILEELGDIRIISGQASMQGIIKELSTQRTLENGAVLSDAQAILLDGEFDSFIIKDPGALTSLTALYNTHETKSFKKHLASSPLQELKNPCISMLAASNEVLFEDLVKVKDIEGGFLARTMIVHESKRRMRNPLTVRPTGMLTTKDLAGPLIEIAKLKGEIKWDGAHRLFEKWYDKLCDISERSDDRTGSLERLGDSVLKTAMGIAISNEHGMEIRQVDLEEAIEACELCITGTRTVSMGQGGSDAAAPTAKVLKVLLGNETHEITRKKILQKLWPDIDSIMLDRVIETLTQVGAIEQYRGPGKVGMVYKMPEHIVKQYKSYKEEVQ